MAYREPQAYRAEHQAEQKRLANHFYAKLCALLERARADGQFDFDQTRITALAACSLPGFLYGWYRPDGRLSADEVVHPPDRDAGSAALHPLSCHLETAP